MRTLCTYIIVLFTLLCSYSAEAQHFDFNDRCKEAYHEVLRLQKSKAIALIEVEKSENPNNLIPLLLEDYIDFLTIYLTEDESLLRELEKNKSIRLAAFDTVADTDPFKKYAKASVYLHWALARIKFEEYFTTATEVYRSYHLVASNIEDFPDFKPNQLLYGLYETILGTIPSNYAWVTKLLGFKGDLENGMNKLRDYRTWAEGSIGDGLYYDEANIFYIYLLVFIADGQEEAWNLCQNELDDPDHLMNVFLVSDVAYKSGHAGEAIDFINQAERNNSNTIPFPFLDFMEGQLRLCELDSSSEIYFERYLSNESSEHYVKDALQRLAFSHLLIGDTTMYWEMMSRVKKEGALFFDCDKQAYLTAQNPDLPHLDLLRARLLFDGGNYQKAIEALSTIDVEGLAAGNRMEYEYRNARIHEMIGKTTIAESHYQKVINLGAVDCKDYFPARSCLAIASINEDEMNFEKARQFFKQTMKYEFHPFTDSFEQQAKAGLNRIKNK